MVNENLLQAFVAFGRVIEHTTLRDADFEEVHTVVFKLWADWNNFVDIQNDDERGYIMNYVQRKALETYK